MDKNGKWPTTSPRRQSRRLRISKWRSRPRARPADLIKINYLVVGLNHEKLIALREARDSVIDKEHPPASTLAGVQALFRDDAQLEIEAEAVIP